MFAAGAINPAVGGRNFRKKRRYAVVSSKSRNFAVSFEKTGGISLCGSLRVRAAGGNSNNGTNAGASYTNANNTATNANANYSSPLYFAKGNINGDIGK